MNGSLPVRLLLLTGLLLSGGGTAGALETESLVRLQALSTRTSLPFTSDHQDASAAVALGRTVLHARPGDGWKTGFNVFARAEFYDQDPLALQAAAALPVTTTPLSWRHEDGEHHHDPDKKKRLSLVADQVWIERQGDLYSLKAGRLPVSLGNTFTFNPNDFFMPFDPTGWYRDYRPGVDGIRLDISTGVVSELSVLRIFARRRTGPDRYRRAAEWDATLLRFSTSLWEQGLTLLAGRLHDQEMAGLSLQMALPLDLDFRFTGHQRRNRHDPDLVYREWAAGLSRQLTTDLSLAGEYYHNGAGADDPRDYLTRLLSGTTSTTFPARTYASLSATMQWSPLWTGQALLLVNGTDDSCLVSLRHTRSLSDEADAALVAFAPTCRKEDIRGMPPQYSLSPAGLQLDYSVYF